MIEINQLTVVFNAGTINQKTALKQIDLTVNAGDFIAIIGGNGAGKSTLLNTIAGSVNPIGGQVRLAGIDITHLSEHKRAMRIGRLFQDPLMGTAPNMTIEENLSLAVGRGASPKFSVGVKKRQIPHFKEQLAAFGLGLENRMKTKVKLLSGGQRQALTLIMATIKLPKLLLLDEHTAALDPKTAQTVMAVTKQIINENQLTALMITHNLHHALDYGNKIMMMNHGKISHLIDKNKYSNLTRTDLMTMYASGVGDSFSDRSLLV